MIGEPPADTRSLRGRLRKPFRRGTRPSALEAGAASGRPRLGDDRAELGTLLKEQLAPYATVAPAGNDEPVADAIAAVACHEGTDLDDEPPAAIGAALARADRAVSLVLVRARDAETVENVMTALSESSGGVTDGAGWIDGGLTGWLVLLGILPKRARELAEASSPPTRRRAERRRSSRSGSPDTRAMRNRPKPCYECRSGH
jgi:hypothetical protein